MDTNNHLNKNNFPKAMPKSPQPAPIKLIAKPIPNPKASITPPLTKPMAKTTPFQTPNMNTPNGMPKPNTLPKSNIAKLFPQGMPTPKSAPRPSARPIPNNGMVNPTAPTIKQSSTISPRQSNEEQKIKSSENTNTYNKSNSTQSNFNFKRQRRNTYKTPAQKDKEYKNFLMNTSEANRTLTSADKKLLSDKSKVNALINNKKIYYKKPHLLNKRYRIKKVARNRISKDLYCEPISTLRLARNKARYANKTINYKKANKWILPVILLLLLSISIYFLYPYLIKDDNIPKNANITIVDRKNLETGDLQVVHFGEEVVNYNIGDDINRGVSLQNHVDSAPIYLCFKSEFTSASGENIDADFYAKFNFPSSNKWLKETVQVPDSDGFKKDVTYYFFDDIIKADGTLVTIFDTYQVYTTLSDSSLYANKTIKITLTFYYIISNKDYLNVADDICWKYAVKNKIY